MDGTIESIEYTEEMAPVIPEPSLKPTSIATDWMKKVGSTCNSAKLSNLSRIRGKSRKNKQATQEETELFASRESGETGSMMKEESKHTQVKVTEKDHSQSSDDDEEATSRALSLKAKCG
jgi:hypothetical protein